MLNRKMKKKVKRKNYTKVASRKVVVERSIWRRGTTGGHLLGKGTFLFAVIIIIIIKMKKSGRSGGRRRRRIHNIWQKWSFSVYPTFKVFFFNKPLLSIKLKVRIVDVSVIRSVLLLFWRRWPPLGGRCWGGRLQQTTTSITSGVIGTTAAAH